MLSTQFPDFVHANRDYPEKEVRHLKIYPEISTSVSGQFGRKNFPELIKRIKNIFHDKNIYFVDTRHDTHFELNNKSVSFKYDNNLHLSQDQIIEREKAAAAFYLNKTITFKQNISHGTPWEELVIHGEAMKDFIETDSDENNLIYQRIALDDQGPMTDQQVENFLSLLLQVQENSGWLHINSVVGGGPAMLLVILEDILRNASAESLQSIAARYDEKFASPAHNSDFLRDRKVDEIKAEKNTARAVFLREFYEFAKTRHEHMQSWSIWKDQNRSNKF